MAARDGEMRSEGPRAVGHEHVRAYSTRPDRMVFVLSGRPDAWIASDLTVDVTE